MNTLYKELIRQVHPDLNPGIDLKKSQLVNTHKNNKSMLLKLANDWNISINTKINWDFQTKKSTNYSTYEKTVKRDKAGEYYNYFNKYKGFYFLIKIKIKNILDYGYIVKTRKSKEYYIFTILFQDKIYKFRLKYFDFCPWTMENKFNHGITYTEILRRYEIILRRIKAADKVGVYLHNKYDLEGKLYCDILNGKRSVIRSKVRILNIYDKTVMVEYYNGKKFVNVVVSIINIDNIHVMTDEKQHNLKAGDYIFRRYK